MQDINVFGALSLLLYPQVLCARKAQQTCHLPLPLLPEETNELGMVQSWDWGQSYVNLLGAYLHQVQCDPVHLGQDQRCQSQDLPGCLVEYISSLEMYLPPLILKLPVLFDSIY